MEETNHDDTALAVVLAPDQELEKEIFFIQEYDQEVYGIIRTLWKLLNPEIPFPFEDPNNATYKHLRDLEMFIEAIPLKCFGKDQREVFEFSFQNIHLYNDGNKKGLAFEYEMGCLDTVALGVLDVVCGLHKKSRKKDIDVVWKIFLLTASYIYGFDESMDYLERESEHLTQCLLEDPDNTEAQDMLDEAKQEQDKYPERDKKIKKMINDLLIQKYLNLEIKHHSQYRDRNIKAVVKAYEHWLTVSPYFDHCLRTIAETESGKFNIPVEYKQTLNSNSVNVRIYDDKMEAFYNDYGGISYNQYKIILEDGTTNKIDVGYPIEALQHLIQTLKYYEYRNPNINDKRLEAAIGLGYKTLATPLADRYLWTKI